jgi:hypothetical protein
MKSKGLGDTIEKFTTATGIKTLVDAVSEITGVDCGCSRRKEMLNNLIPYKQDIIPQNDDGFCEGKYKVLSSFIVNNRPESICYKVGDILYISPKDDMFEKIRIFYKLGILVKDE